jgi:transcriptional regulator with XRE-family HTH domain
MGEQVAKKVAALIKQQEAWQQLVGETFRLVRTSANITQTAFSSELGISQSYVSEIENGSKVPSTETFTKLLNFAEGSSTDGTPL